MHRGFQSLKPLYVSLLAILGMGAPAFAYPVSVTIDVSFSDVGQPDPAHLATRTGSLTTTIDTDSGTGGVYPATIHVAVSGLPALDQDGTVTLSPNGQLVAAFGVTGFSF